MGPALYNDSDGQESSPGSDSIEEIDPEEILRKYLRLPVGFPLNLEELDDPAAGERPALPLYALAQLAIWGSPDKRLKLREIVSAIRRRFEVFRNDTKLAASIRHLLSLYAVFQKLSKDSDKSNNRGRYWGLDLSQSHKHLKRPRKRNRASRKRAMEEDNETSDSPKAITPTRSTIQVRLPIPR
ncbi:hypothetical protein V5O48_004830 [Marasmius crinis-equi]|uniref:Fork-head domain-containing protein n=1 Tax=Marasmius crinis-equi TaxID=585013 RepID=A0ABR3FNZ2_9AGAR